MDELSAKFYCGLFSSGFPVEIIIIEHHHHLCLILKIRTLCADWCNVTVRNVLFSRRGSGLPLMLFERFGIKKKDFAFEKNLYSVLLK